MQEYSRLTGNRIRKGGRKSIALGDGRVVRMPAYFVDLNPVALALITNWVAAGYWLCSDNIISDDLRHLELTQFRNTIKREISITPGHVTNLINDLRLYRYPNKGRVIEQAGKLVLDSTLMAELHDAFHVTKELQVERLDFLLTHKLLGQNKLG